MWKRFLLCGCALVLFSSSLFAGHGDKSRLIRERSREIDRIVEENWAKHEVRGSPYINDQVFMRRAYLDIVGTIPSGREAIEFINVKNPHKRQILIDYLLDTEGYVSHYYNYWADVLRIQSQINNIDLDRAPRFGHASKAKQLVLKRGCFFAIFKADLLNFLYSSMV